MTKPTLETGNYEQNSQTRGKFGIKVFTFSQFPVRVKDPFVGVGRIPLLQGNNPPPDKGFHHMRRGKLGYPELLNTCNVPLHPLIDKGDRSPPFIGHRHQCPTLDRSLFMELNVKPLLTFLSITLY